MKKIKIELTEEQQTWLLRFFNTEWNAEVQYQWTNQDSDTTYLEDMLEVYIALLGKPESFIHGYCIKDDVESKLKDINELKECSDEEVHSS